MDQEPVFGAWSHPVRVTIERSPVWLFARAVKDENPVYASEKAARAAGLAGIPVPPTFTFVMNHGGAWPDIQPEGAPAVRQEVDWDEMTRRKGLHLHGEQEFVYHRWPMVGDTLEARRRVSEPVTRVSKRPMEFTYHETVWSDLAGDPVVTETITALFIPE
jgi:peroxisomal enoyl-CoA hydratase 2